MRSHKHAAMLRVCLYFSTAFFLLLFSLHTIRGLYILCAVMSNMLSSNLHLNDFSPGIERAEHYLRAWRRRRQQQQRTWPGDVGAQTVAVCVCIYLCTSPPVDLAHTVMLAKQYKNIRGRAGRSHASRYTRAQGTGIVLKMYERRQSGEPKRLGFGRIT